MLKTERDEILGARIGSAKKMARWLLKRSSVYKPPVLINSLTKILEEEYELDIIKSWTLSRHVSGFLLQDNEIKAIGYNNEHHAHRKRFSVGHEIGHLVLGHNVIDEGAITDNEEIEANAFAAELLMPLEFLKKDIEKSKFTIDSLAEKYWVSQEAMGHRFQDPAVLKYIK